MKYRTQKILLTGKINDELRDYFVWLSVQLGISLAEAGKKEVLTLPKRYDLSCLSKSYRKSGEMRLDAKLMRSGIL